MFFFIEYYAEVFVFVNDRYFGVINFLGRVIVHFP